MHTIAFVNPTKRFPAEPQLEAAKKHKARAIMNTADGHTIDGLVRVTKRPTRVLVWGIGRLGATPAELRAAFAKLQANDVEIFDMRTGVEVTAKAVAAWVDGLSEVNGEVRMPHGQASKRGKSGAEKRWHSYSAMRKDEGLQAIWRDLAIATDKEAAAKIGAPKRTLFNWWGGSGRKAGPRRK